MKLGFIDILVSLAFSLVVVLGLSLNRKMQVDSIQLVQMSIDTGRPMDWNEKRQPEEEVVVKYERAGLERSVTISAGAPDLVSLSPTRRVDDLWIDKSAWVQSGRLELVGQVHPSAHIHVQVARSWQVSAAEKELLNNYSDALPEAGTDLYHDALANGVQMLWTSGNATIWASQVPNVDSQLASEWKRDIGESLLNDIKRTSRYKYPRRAILFVLAEACARDGEPLSTLVRQDHRESLASEILIGHKYLSERYPTPVPFDTAKQNETLKLAPIAIDARLPSTEIFVLESYVMRWISAPLTLDGFVSGEPVVFSTFSRASSNQNRLADTFAVTQEAGTEVIRTESTFTWNVNTGCK